MNPDNYAQILNQDCKTVLKGLVGHNVYTLTLDEATWNEEYHADFNGKVACEENLANPAFDEDLRNL